MAKLDGGDGRIGPSGSAPVCVCVVVCFYLSICLSFCKYVYLYLPVCILVVKYDLPSCLLSLMIRLSATVCLCACVCACVCVHACVCACMCACVSLCGSLLLHLYLVHLGRHSCFCSSLSISFSSNLSAHPFFQTALLERLTL